MGFLIFILGMTLLVLIIGWFITGDKAFVLAGLMLFSFVCAFFLVDPFYRLFYKEKYSILAPSILVLSFSAVYFWQYLVYKRISNDIDLLASFAAITLTFLWFRLASLEREKDKTFEHLFFHVSVALSGSGIAGIVTFIARRFLSM